MWKKVRRPQEEKSRYIKRLKKCWIYKENQDMKKLVSTDFSAENWLILGKKWSMMIATADKYGCRTLPMRNWHKFARALIAPTILILSDITYEELTHMWISRIFIQLCKRSDITYEELTLLWQKRITADPGAIWVGHYLWGIDTCCNCNFF